MTWYQVRNILARLCFAPDDSQPLGALVSMHPSLLPGRVSFLSLLLDIFYGQLETPEILVINNLIPYAMSILERKY